MKLNREPLPPLAPRPQRFAVLIDGFNFYMGLNQFDPPFVYRLTWCNLQKLAELMVENAFAPVARNRTVETFYYTSRVTDRTSLRKGEGKRQKLWLDAVAEETPEVRLVLGEFRERHINGGARMRVEKKTDVNIALRILEEKLSGSCSGLIVVSGDSDLEPAVRAAALAGLPVVVFNPHDHAEYQMPVDANIPRGCFHMRFLSTDLLETCRLETPANYARWIEYLQSKVESNPKFQVCLDQEKRLRRASSR